jgi:hypothetical protein
MRHPAAVFKPRPAPLTKLAAAPRSRSAAGNIAETLDTAGGQATYAMCTVTADHASVDCSSCRVYMLGLESDSHT